ncbi:DEAD-box ATP-dependent RNA helicase 21 [Tanacetum coccineum]
MKCCCDHLMGSINHGPEDEVFGVTLRYKTPSTIHMATIPLGSQQRDVIVVAGIDPGKTPAFVLPILTYITRLPPISEENEAYP